MKIFNKRNNPQKAFTLIEALVAIAVLMVAITGPMYLASKSLSEANLAMDQAEAGYLAQDAIESVIGIRDTIAINNTSGDWLLGTNPAPWIGSLSLGPCVCNLTGDKCNFDSPKSVVYCTLDSTSFNWAVSTFSTSHQSIDLGPYPALPMTLTYNVNPQTGATTFLKYGYDGYVNTVFTPSTAPPGEAVKLSKFTRYINIEENPANDNKDEALISVLVTWNSPMGLQKFPLQRFIYNYSENL
jgi:type II secretory pathway pseudopilin PulG